MHVHVSRVWPSIISSILYQYNVVYTQSGSASNLTFYLECKLVNGKKRRLDTCSVSPSSQPDSSRVKVHFLLQTSSARAAAESA